MRMSLVNNKTPELWRSFMQNRSQIKQAKDQLLYSLQVYDSPDHFKNFDPAREFQNGHYVKSATHMIYLMEWSCLNFLPDCMLCSCIKELRRMHLQRFSIFSAHGCHNQAMNPTTVRILKCWEKNTRTMTQILKKRSGSR